jgi:hypothetical protein
MQKSFLKPIILLIIILNTINFNCSKDKTDKKDEQEEPEKIDNGFVNYKVDGQQYTTNRASFSAATSTTSRSQILGVPSGAEEPRIIITFQGASAGSYNWGLLCGATNGKAHISFLIPNTKTYGPCYTLDCSKDGSVTSSGNLNITNFATKEGGFTEGNFTVTVYYKECNGQLETKQITGSFKAKRSN